MKKKHYLLIAALSLSLTTTACAATLTACKDDDLPENVQIIDGLTGIYYFDDNGVERTIDLGITSFALDFGEGVKTGVYVSYSDGTIGMLFDNSETATAVFDSGVITLNYNGKTYTLYRRTNFTVNFNVDGGSSVASQIVVNGKKAVRPATNPTRDNSVFIGWYKDAACITPFDFDTEIITSQTTIYAKFITKNANLGIYKATFDLGEGIDEKYPAVETVNRVLYNLPELPAKDGNAFLGWWVSQYNDGTKLSYRYSGQQIFEDVVLYAVWASDHAAVSVTPSGANWSAKGTNKTFDVTVKDAAGNVLARQNNAGTSIAFDFFSADAGDYTVEVTVDGNTTIAYYKNKALAPVKNFTVEGDYFGFLPIETDDPYLLVDYYLDLDCGVQGHTHRHVKLDGYGFDFRNCTIPEGGFKFKVTAEAVDHLASVSEVYTLERSLEKATGLAVDPATDVAFWNAVENAKSYNLELTNGTVTVNETVTGTSFDLRALAPGNWAIKVTPVNTTFYTPEATETTYDKTRLASPQNATFLVDTISWDAVDGASGYSVYVNGTKYGDDLDAATTSVQLGADDFTETGVEYEVTVIALGSDAAHNSLASNAVYIHGTMDGNTVTCANGKAGWNAVRGIAKYGVKVGDDAEFFVTTNEATVTFSKSGTVTIIVTAYTGDTVVGTSSADVIVHAVTFETNGVVDIPTQYKQEGDTVALPEAPSRTGYTFTGWFDAADAGKQLDAEGKTEFVFDSAYPTVYAHWQGNTYTVTLDAGEGALPSGAESEFDVIYGERGDRVYPVPTLADSSQTKVFAGWFTAANGGTQITDDTGHVTVNWNIPQDTTLYAHWGSSGVIYKPLGDGYAALKDPNANNLTTVTVLAYYNGLPVTDIMADAFEGCTAITKLRLPSSIQRILIHENGPTMRGSAFFGMSGLQEIEVYDVEGEKFYGSYDGALYSMANGGFDKLIFVPKGKNVADAPLRIADGTKTIGHHAAASLNQITEVVIPSSVTLIENSAFTSNSALNKVTFLPAANGQLGDALQIEKMAFKYCSALTEITFPKRLVNFSMEIFNDVTASKLVSGSKIIKNVYIQELGDTKDRATNYYDLDGVLCEADKIVYFPIGRGDTYQTPSGISRIGEAAFMGNTAITSVRFVSLIEEIGIDAFYGCTGLTSITFDQRPGNGDLAIRERAFYGCTNLNNVILPPSLKTLEVNAFGNTISLRSVTINSNRSEVDYADGAFTTTTESGGTGNINTVHIGADVAAFNLSGVFGASLRNIDIDDRNDNFVEDGGIVYNQSLSEILYFPDSLKELTISDKMTIVKNGVFRGKIKLKSVTIGANVETIEDSAFEDCFNLETITFEAGTAPLSIGNRAFYRTNALKTLTINGRGGADITIGESAFVGTNTNSTLGIPAQSSEFTSITLPEGVKSIGKFAFDGRTYLTDVNLPASLTQIDTFEVGDTYRQMASSYGSKNVDIENVKIATISIFNGDENLTNINVAEGNAKYASVDGVLYAKNEAGEKATLLCVPRKAKGALLPDTETGEYGYLSVPATVTEVADYAFFFADGIKQVVFEGTSDTFTLGNGAFSNASGLTSVGIPAGVAAINEGLFKGCDSLSTVRIPNTVETIGKSAFKGCASLTEVKFDSGNDGLPLNIENGENTATGDDGDNYTGAFAECSSLKTIEFPKRLASIGDYTFAALRRYSGGYYYDSVLETVKIPASATRIGRNAFYNCRSLKNVLFFTDRDTADGGAATQADEATETTGMTIEQSAFYYCALSLAETTFTLPDTLVLLGNSALYGTGITEITIPARVKEIGTMCLPSTLVTVKFETMEKDGKQVNSLTALPSFGSSTSKYPLTSIELEKCTEITSIPDNAFRNTNLGTIRIPAQVTSIGKNAFNGCKNLTDITFGDVDGISSTAKIDDAAFAFSGLTSFTFPTLADDSSFTLGASLFEGCFNLNSLIISKSVQTIGSALSKAPDLTGKITVNEGSGVLLDDTNHLIFSAISLANKTYKIESSFSAVPVDQSGKFTVPNTFKDGRVIEIGDNAFAGQNAVRVFVIPANIETIGTKAFSQCRALETVEFTGESRLNEIKANAFEHTYNFESIVLPNSVTKIGAAAFTQSGIRTVTLPNELSVAGNEMFKSCLLLETVNNFPQITKAITSASDAGRNMFQDCRSLKTVNFNANATKLPQGAFKGCIALESLDLTGITEIANVTSTSYCIFDGCTGLTELTLDANLTTLPGYFFYNCVALKTVYRSDKLAEDEGKETADTYRVKNQGIYDLSQITALGGSSSYGAFKNNTAVEVIDLRSAKEFKTTYTFAGCTALTKVTLGTITSNLLVNYMFDGCTNLKTVNYWDGTEIVGKDNEVTLPDTVKFLGTYAFRNSGIEKITVPNSVTMLGTAATTAAISGSAYTFNGCTKLETVILPSGLTRIAAYVFNGCENLTTIQVRDSAGKITGDAGKITLPSGLVAIGNRSFMNCKSITAIDLSKVTEIGTSGAYNAGLFAFCEKLESVTLNDSLTTLGSGMFVGCKALKTIKLPNSLIYTGQYTFRESGLTEVILPANVRFLGAVSSTSPKPTGETTHTSQVFYGCESLETVYVTENLEKMGTSSFEGCINLRSVKVVDSTKVKWDAKTVVDMLKPVTDEETKTVQTVASNLVQVPNGAFSKCAKLELVDLSKVTFFGTGSTSSRPFYNCTSLKEADISSAETVPSYLFDGCENLETVTLSSGLTTVSAYMFQNCKKLSTIYASGTAEADRVADEADLSGITSFGVVSSSNSSGYAFSGCSSLAVVHLNDEVTAIPSETFMNCSSLRDIKLPAKLESIAIDSFLNCSSLTSLEIPASVTSIAGNVFIGCSSLTLSVAAGNEKYAVSTSRRLYNKNDNTVLFVPSMTAGAEPENVTEITFAPDEKLYAYMFNGYANVTSVTLPANLTQIPNYALWNFKGNLGADFEIPAGVTSIGNYAFYQNPQLTSIVIPEGVKTIGNYAFANNENLEEIVIPEGVTSLGDRAFAGCTKLRKVTFPSTLASLGYWTFYGCENLEEVVFTGTTEETATPVEIGDSIFRGCSKLKSIPSNRIVSAIGSYAFYNCNALQSVTLGEIKGKIGNNAFYRCTSLQGSLNFKAGVTEIGDKTFMYCTSLEGVHFEAGVTTIGNYAFIGCSNLKSANIPYTVNKIGYGTFTGCTQLANMTFDETPEGVAPVEIKMSSNGSASLSPSESSLENYAYVADGVYYYGLFAGCAALKSLTIPEGRMTAIPVYAFVGSGLESWDDLVIPRSVTEFSTGAFWNLPFTSVTVPYQLKKLGAAFTGCAELASVTFEATPEGESEVTLAVSGGAVGDAKAVGNVYFDEASGKYYGGVFVGAKLLTSITLPARWSDTSKYAFAFTGLTEVNIGGAAKIGEGCFKSAPLTEVTVPEGSLTEFGKSAFDGCTSVAQIVLPATVKLGSTVFLGWTENQEVLINVGGSEFNATSTYAWSLDWFVTDVAANSIVKYDVTGVTFVPDSTEEGGENAAE